GHGGGRDLLRQPHVGGQREHHPGPGGGHNQERRHHAPAVDHREHHDRHPRPDGHGHRRERAGQAPRLGRTLQRERGQPEPHHLGVPQRHQDGARDGHAVGHSHVHDAGLRGGLQLPVPRRRRVYHARHHPERRDPHRDLDQRRHGGGGQQHSEDRDLHRYPFGSEQP